MTELSDKILQYLAKNEEINTLQLAKLFEEDHQKVVGALKSIQAFGNIVTAEAQSEKYLELTEEGQLVAQQGTF